MIKQIAEKDQTKIVHIWKKKGSSRIRVNIMPIYISNAKTKSALTKRAYPFAQISREYGFNRLLTSFNWRVKQQFKLVAIGLSFVVFFISKVGFDFWLIQIEIATIKNSDQYI